MKNSSILLAVAAAMGFSASTLSAATVFSWDGGNTANTGADGGSGTWNASNTNWVNSGNSNVAWPASGEDNEAVFGGTAGTVTVSGTVNTSKVTFSTSGYVLQGGTVNMNGATPTIEAGTGVSATISSQITGNAGLTKAGNGTVILSGTNTYTGGTAISAGTLQVSGGAALADNGSVTLNAAGATCSSTTAKPSVVSPGGSALTPQAISPLEPIP